MATTKKSKTEDQHTREKRRWDLAKANYKANRERFGGKVNKLGWIKLMSVQSHGLR